MTCRNLVLAFLTLLLLPVHSLADDKITKEKLDSQNRKRTYYLYVPDSLPAGASVPLIVLLHGSGRNGLSLVEKWKELARAEGLIIVGPDSIDTDAWRIPEDGPQFIYDLIEALKAKHPIDSRRIYLFGHSAGAVQGLNLSMLESEYFAATAVHAGSWREKKEFLFMENAKRKIPLAILVGDRDAFFPLSSVRETESALKGRGFQVEVAVMKDHDHWYYDLAGQINRNAWSFLKQHRLVEEPRYEPYNVDGARADANAAVNEINALRMEANELMQRFYAKEEELSRMETPKDKVAIARIAREQIELLNQSAARFRAASSKAEGTSKLKLGGKSPQYFSVLAQLDRKRVEALEALKERAEFLLGDDVSNAARIKMNEAARRAEQLNKEADDLQQQADRIMAGQGR